MKKYKLLTVVFALVFSSVCSASLITDTVSQNVKVGWWETYSFSHVLNESGEDLFALGSAVSASLEIAISDDGGRFDFWETILVTVEDFDFDTGGILFSATNFINDLEVNALGALNADGILDVSVKSLFGDFYVGNSLLTVETLDVVAVPEPSILALFGVALVGLGFVCRQKAK